MLTSGEVVDLDLGTPAGREAGHRHPGIIVTAQHILDAQPTVVQVVPLTGTVRAFGSEVVIGPEPGNGLAKVSAAQCQHVRSVSVSRVLSSRGNVGPTALAQLRETIALILDLP